MRFKAGIFLVVLATLIALSAGVAFSTATALVTEGAPQNSTGNFSGNSTVPQGEPLKYCRELPNAELKRLFSLSKAGELTQGFALEFLLSCEDGNSSSSSSSFGKEKWAYLKYSTPKRFSPLGIEYRGKLVFSYDGSSAKWSQGPFLANIEERISSFEKSALARAFFNSSRGVVEGYLDYPFITLRDGDDFLTVETRGNIVYGFALRRKESVKNLFLYYPFLSENSTEFALFSAERGGIECAIGSYYSDSLVVFGRTDIEGLCVTNEGNYMIFEKGRSVEGTKYPLIRARDYKENYPQSFAFKYDDNSAKYEDSLVIVRKKPGFFDPLISFFRGLFSRKGK